MSGKRLRRSWSAEDRETAIALAREHGTAYAAVELGIPAGTIRSWVVRAADAAPVAPDVEREAETLAEVQPSALSVADWVRLQRQAERRLRKALTSGSASDCRWLSLTVGVLADKVRLALAEAPALNLDERAARLLAEVEGLQLEAEHHLVAENERLTIANQSLADANQRLTDALAAARCAR